MWAERYLLNCVAKHLIFQGDSGGSAMYEGKLVGVANFVMSGCGSTYPDGYAKVSFFVDWINKTISNYEAQTKSPKAAHLILI